MGLAQSSGATRTTLSRELTLRNQLATMFGFTSTTQVTHSQCQAHPLPVSRSFACSPTRLVNRFQSKGCRCAPMRSRQSCAIMYHGERCSSCRNATCVASTALRVLLLAPRRRLSAGSIVASKHASRAETRVKSRNKKYNTHSPKDLITPAGAARARQLVASLYTVRRAPTTRSLTAARGKSSAPSGISAPRRASRVLWFGTGGRRKLHIRHHIRHGRGRAQSSLAILNLLGRRTPFVGLGPKIAF